MPQDLAVARVAEDAAHPLDLAPATQVLGGESVAEPMTVDLEAQAGLHAL